ncbi:hypothetical protein A2U01_0114114, partial [Trifolium medium]|nr:hypothetical protein [Trifolium medium]
MYGRTNSEGYDQLRGQHGVKGGKIEHGVRGQLLVVLHVVAGFFSSLAC